MKAEFVSDLEIQQVPKSQAGLVGIGNVSALVKAIILGKYGIKVSFFFPGRSEIKVEAEM